MMANNKRVLTPAEFEKIKESLSERIYTQNLEINQRKLSSF